MASSYSPKNLISGIVLLVVLLVSGTIGYMVIEKWHFLNALYMTVITIITVGYGEVSKISKAGRIFTIVLIFVGVGIVAYMLGLVAQSMLDFQLRSILGRRKLGLKTKIIKNHYRPTRSKVRIRLSLLVMTMILRDCLPCCLIRETCTY